MHTANPFLARRQALLAHMQVGIAVIPTAMEQPRSRDTHFPYRPDSYFHFLTGFAEPEAVLVLVAGPEPKSLLFCRVRDENQEIWNGLRCGPERAAAQYGFDEAHPITAFDEILPKLLAGQPCLWYGFAYDAAWDQRIAAALNRVRAAIRSGEAPPARMEDVRVPLDAMRLTKDASELVLMRRAADISAAAHRRAMQKTKPGCYEYEIEAELLYEFRRQGCAFPAYTPIVAGGANACILHYVDNCRRLVDGDLLLIDAGGEWEGYAADITRTFPVNGRFTSAQAAIYDLVLAAQVAALAAVRPDANFLAPHEAALHTLVDGLCALKLLNGSIEENIEQEHYKRFFMHRSSHWLGRDVHDAGSYREAGNWRTLGAGMVLTLEPGLYIRAASDIPESFHNIGVRIEDDVLVTATGAELLTADAPKTRADIETLMHTARQ